MDTRAELAALNRRLRAASSELGDPVAAAEAAARMTYLCACSLRHGGVLDHEELEVAIWSFFTEYPNGVFAATGPKSPRRRAGQTRRRLEEGRNG